MGVGEQGPTGREPIEVWRVDTFAPPHAVDPIVEIVHRDKEDIGPLKLGGVDRQVKVHRWRQDKEACKKTRVVGIHGMREIREGLS